ncbi:ATP-binding protein [Kitasatospora sp. NPDC059160]|uniref:ATP-binding protein n=1 Tax=Kitasatospora sp. NPDC059160 TaxID=3346748 RepID=UPI0036C5A64C
MDQFSPTRVGADVVNRPGTSAGAEATPPSPWAFFWLPRHRQSVPAARSLLRDFLRNLPGGAALVEPGELVLSELVTNSVVHARVPKGRRIAVRFDAVCEHLRIEVHDASSERPVIRRSTGPDATSGRGLCLVEALSAEWGCQPRPEGIGKITWALVGPEGGGR